MTSLVSLLRKLLGSKPETPVSIPLDIPDDLQQAVAALMYPSSESPPEGGLRAHLSPDRVSVQYGRHLLKGEGLAPQHILACWVAREGRWEPCEAAEFLAQRGTQVIWRTEFALYYTGTQAIIVRQSLVQVTPNRCGGGGGTTVLKRTPDGWVKSDEPGEAWII